MANRQNNQRITTDIIPLAMDLSDEGDEEETRNMFQVPKRNLLGDFGRPSVLEPPVSEHMKVYLRIRPFSEEELNKGEDQGCLTKETSQVLTTHAPKDSHYYKNTVRNSCRSSTKYTFSHIFNAGTSQNEFFNQTMLGLVKDFIDGQNCLVFSYGVTNSGKTYTIQGNASDGGVLPRALDVLFNSINGRQWEGMDIKPDLFMNVTRLSPDKELMEKKIKERVMKLGCEDDMDVMSLLGEDASDMSIATNTTTCSESSNISTVDSKDSLDGGEKLLDEINNRVREEAMVSVDEQGQIKFSVWVSFAEIYNEQIYDLLEPLSKKKNAKRPCLKLSEDQNGSPYIKGLKYINVCSADEAYKLMTIGQRNLKTACTRLNQNSSRSHCIFNIKVLRVVDKDSPHVARVSMLSLCDLAGSERYGKTQASGDRLKEAGNINTSLLTLGRCIETLRHNQAHKEHSRIVPFRESKLTRLFQNFFIGRGKAIMFVNVNQCASMFDETQHVFKFSAIASQVVVKQKPIFIKPKLPVPPSPNPIPRSSISWATPARNRMVEQKSVENIPLPEDSDEDLEEEEPDVYTRENIDELLGVIEMLQKDLESEMKSKDMLESAIRKEVCVEMMKQFTQIEEECGDRIRVREQMAEDYAEKRIQILMDGERGRRKKEVMTDADDEWVSSIFLHQEKVKVEERDKTISSMKGEMERLSSKVSELEKDRLQLRAENETLKQQLSEARTQQDVKHKAEMEELGQKLAEYEAKVQALEKEVTRKSHVTEDSGNADLIENFTQQLQQSREQLKEQEKEIGELNDMLTEAGETFQQKQDEIDQLKELTSDYEKKLEAQSEALSVLERAASDSKVAIETADQSLTKREECVGGLQAQIRELEGDVNKYRNKARYFEKDLVEKEEEAVHLKQKVETLLTEHSKNQEALIHGFTAEIGNYKSQLLQLKAQLCGVVRSPTKSPGGSLRSPGGTLRSPHSKLELFPMSPLSPSRHEHMVLSPAKHTAQEDRGSMTPVGKQMKALQSELDKNCAMVAKLEHTLKVSKSSVSELEKNLEAEKGRYIEARNKVEELETKVKTLEDKNESSGKNDNALLQDKERELEKANEKIKELEPLMKDYFSKSRQVADSESKIKELQSKVDEQQVCVRTLEHEIETLKATVAEKEKAVELLEERKEELEVVNEELKGMVNKTTTDLEAKEVEIKALSPQVHKTVKCMMNQTDKRVLNSPIVVEKNKEIDNLHTKVSKLKSGLRVKALFCSETTEKCKELEFRIDEKEIESQDLKQELEQSSHKIEDLQAALETKMKDLTSTGEELAVVSLAMEKLKRAVAEIRAENERLQSQLQTKNGRGVQEDGTKAKLQAEIDKLKELLTITKADSTDLANKVQQLKATSENTQEKVVTLESLLKEKDLMMEKLEEKITITKAEQDQGILENKCKELREAQNEIEKLKVIITEKDEEIEMFSQNLNSILEEREHEEIVKSNAMKQIKEIQMKLADKESLVIKLEENLESAQRSNESLKAEGETLQSSITQQEELISELRSKVGGLNASARRTDVLETSVHDLESAVADNALELETKETILQERDSEIMELKSQLKHLQEVSITKLQTDEADGVSHALVEDKLKEVQRENESLLQTNGILEKSVQDLKKELTWKVAEIESQETELNTIREQLTLSLQSTTHVERSEKATETCSSIQEDHDDTDGTSDDKLGNALVEIAQLKASEHAQRSLHHNVKGELQEALLEVENCRCELRQLRENVSKLEQLEQLVEDKSTELEKAEKLIAELKETDQMTKQNKDDMNNEVERKDTEIKYIQRQLEKVEKQLNISNEKVSLHDRINADLREEYERKLEKQQKEIESNEEKYSSVEKELNVLKGGTDEITVTVLKLKEQVTTKMSEINDRDSAIHSLEQQLQDLSERNDNLLEELEQKKTQIEEMTKCAEQEKKKASERNDTEQQVKSLEIQLKEVSEKNIDLIEELKEKETQIEKMQNSADLEKREESVKGNCLNDAMREIEQLKATENSMKASTNKVKGELQDALLEIENSRSEMENLRKQAGQHEDLENKLEVTGQKLEVAEQKLVEAGQNQEVARQKLEVAEQKLAETGQKLAEAGQNQEVAEQKLEVAEQKLAEAGQNQEVAEQKLEVAEQKLEVAEQKLAEAGQNQEVAEQKLEVAEQKLEVAEQSVTELKCKLETLEKEVKVKEVPSHDPLLQRKLNTMVSKLNECEIKNRALIKEVTQLQSTVEKLEEELEEARQTSDVLSEREIHRRSRASFIQLDPRQSISSPSTKLELVKSKDRERNLSEQLKKASVTMQEWLGQSHDNDNKLQQKIQELSHARQTIEHLKAQQSEIARSTDKELQEYMDQNNELKIQILRHEGDLEIKGRTIADLERKLHTEHGDLKAYEKDKAEKEAMISLMKETLSDQDTILQQQEELLNNKDTDIQASDAEYKELQQKYQALLETKNSTQQEIRAEQKNVARIEAERDLLREQLSTMETKLQEVESRVEIEQKSETDLEQKLRKVVEEKEKLARIVRENNQELKELEKSLTEARRECEELRSEGADKCAETKIALAQREWDKTLHELNAKIKTLQCNNKEVRFNVSTLEKKLEKSGEEKHTLDRRLQEFRDERDKLVSGLEAVLKKKDNEVKQHKELIKQLKEKEIHITQSLQDERRKIGEGLKELNKQSFTVKTEVQDDSYEASSPAVMDESSVPETPVQDTKPASQSNSRNRPARPAAPPKSQSSEPQEEEEIETTQIQTFDRSPGMARRKDSSVDRDATTSATKTSTTRRGRKRISPAGQDDTLPPLPKRRSKDSVADASMLSETSEDYSTHRQVDATPPVAAKTLRRTRKKNGSTLDLSTNEEEKPAKTTKRTSRTAKRGAKHRLLESFRESPMGKTSKRILDNIAETFSPRSPSKSPKKEEKLKRCKSESKENIPASVLEASAKKKPAGRGKPHRLYSEDYISEPFDNTGDFVQSPDEIHQTVTRSLRSRRK